VTSKSFKKVKLADVRHVRIFYDDNMYAAHTNRGGIWNFGAGEIAVAHLLKPIDYTTGEGVDHGYSNNPGAGVMLNRSYDSGETWPEDKKHWIWNNNRSIEEIRSWLYDDPDQHDEIDMTHSDAIMHFGQTQYIRRAESGPDPINHGISFCLRSQDKGHTWDSKPSLVPAPPFLNGGTVANLGYIRFPNGVLGIAPSGCYYYVSYDQGLTWDCVSTVAYDPLGRYDYTYGGVHQLPDGRLFFCMHRLLRPLGDYPCVAFSDDGGMTWSEPRYIVRPDHVPAAALPKPGSFELPKQRHHWFNDNGKPIGSWYNAYRSPCALVTRDGRIVIIFGRRRPPYGIGGVVSDDLGETWSQEFVLRDDGCCGDLGYPVVTELDDGRIFTAYYISVADREGRIPSVNQDRGAGQLAWSAIRHVAGTSFRLE
jgi:hypothetical protein